MNAAARYLKRTMYLLLAILTGAYICTSFVGPYWEDGCTDDPMAIGEGASVLSREPSGWNNPMFLYRECRYVRSLGLLGLNIHECEMFRRVFVAAAFGAMIGFERKLADRPAGMLTMSIVAIGAAVYTIVSGFGFYDSDVIWDSSRVAAKVPDGIGFLCAGVIFKAQDGTVRGLTTAASIWLSGAVGTAAGCGMYFAAAFTAMLTVSILKFGPRNLGNELVEDFERQETEGDRSTATELTRLVDPDEHETGMGAYGTTSLRSRRRGHGTYKDPTSAAVMLDW